ncbi:MAG: hypothetical protein R3B96_03990 [Pirellulaceae bacterium]
MDATDVSAQQAIAELLIGSEKFDEALATINKVIEANPDAAASYLVHCCIHMIQENSDEVLADLTKAIDLDPRTCRPC